VALVPFERDAPIKCAAAAGAGINLAARTSCTGAPPAAVGVSAAITDNAAAAAAKPAGAEPSAGTNASGSSMSKAVTMVAAKDCPKLTGAGAAAAAAAAAAAEEPQKSIFEIHLCSICDEDGGIKLPQKMPNFVWLMRNAEKNAERSLVTDVIHRIKVRRCTCTQVCPR